MCGRFALTTPVDGLRRLFGFSQIPNLPPRWNIAPTQAVLTVRASKQGPSATMMRWGLIPSWSKDPPIGAKMINARSETVREKPSFKNAFRRRRCLIPADAFYEWKTIAGAKQPFRIAFEDQKPLAFAGLWEHWHSADGSEVESCSIVTTEANDAIRDIHHRMPVILDSHQFDLWLTGEEGAAASIMTPYSGTRTLGHYPISKRLNDVRNDDDALTHAVELPKEEPPPPEKPDDQMSLF